MASVDLLRNLCVYTGNIGARILGNVIKPGSNIGNPYGAIGYGLLDILRDADPRIANSKYVRLLEAGGGAFYTAKTVGNLVSLVKGNAEALLDLPFNLSMAYELVRNAVEDYQGTNPVKDIRNVPNDFRGKSKDNSLGSRPSEII